MFLGPFMDRPTHHSKIAFWGVSIAGVSTFLALQGTLYRLEEVLACWLLFTLMFAFLVITVATGVAIYSATLGMLRLIAGAARAILHVRLATPTLHTK